MRRFRSLTLSTIIAVFVLILVGGVVRSTGSGMGCPDWPKCFGRFVPPTDVSELPADYKEFYAGYRAAKNVRFARYLSAIGMDETAQQILNDKSILVEADFNALKTWVEYINRLIGVLIGFMIFLVSVFSLRFWKTKKSITLFSFATLFGVGFQGWIGSFVVSSNLTPWTVTVHMFLALVVVALLILVYHLTDERQVQSTKGSSILLIACIAALLLQILFGTQVREAIDVVASLASRSEWISRLGAEFIIHRSFSWLVLFLHAALLFNLRKTSSSKVFSLWLFLVILATILSGTGMAYAGVPAFLQPLHLLLATVCFGLQFLLLLRLNQKSPNVVNHTA